MLKAFQRLVNSRLGPRTSEDVEADLKSPHSLTKLALQVAIALQHNRKVATELAQQNAKAHKFSTILRDFLGGISNVFELGIEGIVLEKLEPKLKAIENKIKGAINSLDSAIKHNAELLNQYNAVRQQALQPWQDSQANYINKLINGTDNQPGLKQQLPDSLKQSLQKTQAEQAQLQAQGKPHVVINTDNLDFKVLGDAIVNDFAKEQANKPTLLEAESEYLQSMQQYEQDRKATPKTAKQKDIGLQEARDTQNIAGHNVVLTELRLQFLIREYLQEHVQMTGKNRTRVANRISRDIMQNGTILEMLNSKNRVGELVKQYDLASVKGFTQGETQRRYVRDISAKQLDIRDQLNDLQKNMAKANGGMAQIIKNAQQLITQAQGLQAEMQYNPGAYNKPTPLSTRPKPWQRVKKPKLRH